MRSSLLLPCCITLLFACEKGTESPPPAAGSSGPAESAKAAGAPAKAQAPAASAGENLKKAAESAKQLLDPAKVASSDYSIDQLKQSMSSLSTDNLKSIADKLVASLQTNGDTVKSLQDQIGKLGLADMAKAGELKTNLDSAGKLVTSLKAKLKVVTDQLKASGVDVSSYTSVLGG
ncbi:MAG: hypothetical protein U1E76_15365 [Planctomycetota bacterium]